jgi:drug/metabolite transporter (DMT)-like permease
VSSRPAAAAAHHRGLELALVGVAAVWGFTFPVVKDAVEVIPPNQFLAVRFGIAAALMTLVFGRALRRFTLPQLLASAAAGIALFAGYAFQTIGLQHTTASNAGFITGLFVVFTPMLTALLLKRLPSRRALVGVGLATAGLVLLGFRPRGFRFGYGEALVLLCAVSFAVHIVILGRFARDMPAGPLTTVQMWVTAALSAWASLFVETPVDVASRDVWLAIVLTAVYASAIAFFIQTRAQQVVSPTRTALILVSEPAFAGLFGFVLLGETLTIAGWLGAGLILSGMVNAELAPVRAEEG